MQKIYLTLIILFSTQITNAQTINNPNYGQKTHETLSIEKIELNEDYTIITLSITNKIANGSFCADKNIYLKNSNGYEMYQVIRKEGIPECPNSHFFLNIDEKLIFKLYFPKISKQIKYIDLTENCENACFNFKGVILSENLNYNINEAYSLFSTNKKQAATSFENLISQTTDYPYGFLYFAAIKAYEELKNSEKVSFLKENLKKSIKIDKNFTN